VTIRAGLRVKKICPILRIGSHAVAHARTEFFLAVDR